MNGYGVGDGQKDVSPTLQAGYSHGAAIVYRPFDLMQITNKLHKNNMTETETNGTLNTGTPGVVEERGLIYLCRRLTPLECCRLQGFPDYWCKDIEVENPTDEELEFWRNVFETHRQVVNPNGKPKTEKQIRKWLKSKHSESAEYKMWGNGVALPCVFFILKGIEWWDREGQYTQPPFGKFECEEYIQSTFLEE